MNQKGFQFGTERHIIPYSLNHSSLWRYAYAPLHPSCNTVILWLDPPPPISGHVISELPLKGSAVLVPLGYEYLNDVKFLQAINSHLCCMFVYLVCLLHIFQVMKLAILHTGCQKHTMMFDIKPDRLITIINNI